MEDKPPAGSPGRTLAIVLAICLLIIILFFIGFKYSERDKGALIVPGAAQTSEMQASEMQASETQDGQ